MSDSLLKSRFTEAMEKSIEQNRAAPLSQFKTESELLKHYTRIDAWQQALDAFNDIDKGIENEKNIPPAPPAQMPQTQVESTTSATVTEGEIVE